MEDYVCVELGFDPTVPGNAQLALSSSYNAPSTPNRHHRGGLEINSKTLSYSTVRRPHVDLEIDNPSAAGRSCLTPQHRMVMNALPDK